MSKKKHKIFLGEINIFYFFLVALAIHLAFLFVREYNVKGDSNLSLNSNSAPISVQVQSKTFKKPRPSVASAPQEEVKQEEVENKKEIKKEYESKIKDKKKKKEVKKKKTPKKKVEGEKTQKKVNESTPTPPKPKNVETDINSDQDFLSGNFSIGTDGIVTASSADGIDYHILKQVDPDYPAQAKRVRYSKKVVVRVRFLVNLRGNIEDIKIIQGHKKLGFDKEVLKALKHWQFKPIYYKKKNIKVYFTKDFVFENK